MLTEDHGITWSKGVLSYSIQTTGSSFFFPELKLVCSGNTKVLFDLNTSKRRHELWKPRIWYKIRVDLSKDVFIASGGNSYCGACMIWRKWQTLCTSARINKGCTWSGWIHKDSWRPIKPPFKMAFVGDTWCGTLCLAKNWNTGGHLAEREATGWEDGFWNLDAISNLFVSTCINNTCKKLMIVPAAYRANNHLLLLRISASGSEQRTRIITKQEARLWSL